MKHNHINYFVSADATVTLQDEELSGCEGDTVMLCATLSVVKALSIELRVSFNLSDGSASMSCV